MGGDHYIQVDSLDPLVIPGADQQSIPVWERLYARMGLVINRMIWMIYFSS